MIEKNDIKEIDFSICGFFPGKYLIKINATNQTIEYSQGNYYEDTLKQKKLSKAETDKIIEEIINCNVEKWCKKKTDIIILDGLEWKLEIKFNNRRTIKKTDTSEFPDEWFNLLKIIQKYTNMDFSNITGECFNTEINDFKKLFEPEIQKRGEEYYQNKKIIELKEKNNVYFAKVKGERKYDVKASIYENCITEISCSCPYFNKYEGYCKHIYAVLNEINNKIINKNPNYKYIGKKLKIKIDRPMGSKHPKHGFIYPVNYGYMPNTTSGDGEELDAYVLGIFEPIKEFKGKCIAIIHRTNDNDDKLIIVPENIIYNNDQIIALTEFQERFFKSIIIRKK